MQFFTGLHQPADAKHFDAAFVSVNRLRDRKGPFAVGDWIMDSGAFTEVSKHGRYRHEVAEYASQIRRWKTNGNLLAAVAQDYMCEPFIVTKTGLTVERHQQFTVERYDALLAEDTGVYILPVLQGYDPSDYARHVRMYGDRLAPDAWVGVGSVCKRNGDPGAIAAVLLAIKGLRPDLRLHGFGLKTTALSNPLVRSLLETADSMAWSFSARKQGRNANDWREAKRWTEKIASRSLTVHVTAVTLAARPVENQPPRRKDMIEIKLNFASVALALAFLEAGNATSKPATAETPQPDPAMKPGKSATDKPAATVKPTAKTEDVAPKTQQSESSALTYEVVGAAISKAVTDPANKPAVKALLGEFDAKDGSGKATNGQKLKPEDYPAFMEKLAAIGEDLG